MKRCDSCGAVLEDEAKVCPECGIETEMSDEDEFNVLYDIEGFDVFEEERFEAMRKQKLVLKIIAAVLVGLIVALIAVSFVRMKNNAENEADINYESTYNHTEEVPDEGDADEHPEDSEPGVIAGRSEAEGKNNIEELKHEVKRISSNYNNRRTPYDGQLLGVVDDNGDIIATYIIPDALPFEEREGVVQAEKEIKQRFADELDGKFPEEIKVNVKIKVSYR